MAAQRARRLGRHFILFDNLLVVAGFYMVFPLIGLHFVDQLGWAAGVVGLALGLRQLSQQGLGLVGGSLADRYGVKPLIVCGMLLRAAGFALLAWADHAGVLILSCIASGLGGALFEPSRSALVIKLTRPHQRNSFYALLMTQESAGAMAGATLGAWLLRFDFHWVALGGAAVFVLAALFNAWLLPSYRSAAARTPLRGAARQVLSDRPFLLLALTLSGYYVMYVQIMMMMPVLLKQLAGTAQAVGWMYSLDAALSICLLYPLARFAERHFSLQARVLAGVGIMSVGLAAMSQAASLAQALCFVAAFYIGSLITEPAREQLLARYARPEARASYMGLSRMGFAIGGLFGYTAGGTLLDQAHRLHMPAMPWLMLSAIGALTVCALYAQFYPARGIHHDAALKDANP